MLKIIEGSFYSDGREFFKREIEKAISINPEGMEEILEDSLEFEKERKKKGLVEKEIIPYRYEPALFYRQMVDAGILGVIQSSEIPIRALYDRKNCMDMTWETLPTTPDIKLNEDQYKEIEKMVERREYFQLEFDIRNHFKMGPVKFHNYIGVMKGSKYPNEYVLSGGHLDAFDVATGGVDYFGKKAPTNKNFGGGGGTSVTVSPIGFLVVDPKGKVELLNVNAAAKDPISQIVGLIESSPEIIEKFKNLFGKKGNNDLDEE